MPGRSSGSARSGLRGLDACRARGARAGHEPRQARALSRWGQKPFDRRAGRERSGHGARRGRLLHGLCRAALHGGQRAGGGRWRRALRGQGRRCRERLMQGLAQAEQEGASVLLDGRTAPPPAGYEAGNWLGPSVVGGVTPGMQSAQIELFGPLLSVIRVKTLDEALALEQLSPYGNATSIFTQSGAVASYVAERATSGMVGVNIGVPVPREPFSFGGTKDSKFGQGDMTGPAGVELWSNLKKITTKWAPSEDATWMS